MNLIENVSGELVSAGQQSRHEAIALRAYRLWEERGAPIGSPEDDWLRAEHEFDGEALRSGADGGSGPKGKAAAA